MTRLQYLLDCRERYAKWMDMSAEELDTVGGGALTHDKVFLLVKDVELELLDHEVFDAYGRMSYSEEAYP